MVDILFGILVGVVVYGDATKLLSAVFLELVEAVSVLGTELLDEGQTPLRPDVLLPVEAGARADHHILTSRLLVQILHQG